MKWFVACKFIALKHKSFYSDLSLNWIVIQLNEIDCELKIETLVVYVWCLVFRSWFYIELAHTQRGHPFVRNVNVQVYWWNGVIWYWSLKLIILVRIEENSAAISFHLRKIMSGSRFHIDDGHRLDFCYSEQGDSGLAKCLSENYHFVSISSFHQHQFQTHLHIFTIFSLHSLFFYSLPL